MLCKIRGVRKRQKLYDITTYLWNKKKKSQTHKNRELNGGCQGLGAGASGEMLLRVDF